MKKQLIIASIAIALSAPAAAQFATDSIKAKTSKTAGSESGTLLATLAGALNPDSYKPAYAKEKSAFTTRARSAKNESVVAGQIAEFINYIKPEKFKKDVNVEELVSAGQAAKSKKQTAALLQRVEASLDKNAISSMWGLSRASWVKEIQKLLAAK